jgi:hypothetical protein
MSTLGVKTLFTFSTPSFGKSNPVDTRMSADDVPALTGYLPAYAIHASLSVLNDVKKL